MAIVKLIKKQYDPEDGGAIVPYERLAIIGSIDGEIHTLEVKLPSKSDYMLAGMLLKSTESSERQVNSRATTDDEKDSFFKTTKRKKGDDKINLDEDD